MYQRSSTQSFGIGGSGRIESRTCVARGSIRATNRLVRSFSFLMLSSYLLSNQIAEAQSGSYVERVATLVVAVSKTAPRLESPVVTFTPTQLGGDSTIQLISTPSLAFLGPELLDMVRKNHREFSSLLGGITGVKSTLRLIDAEEFYAVTQLPSWTNAMFFRSQLVIPIDTTRNLDRKELERSLRHEYFHAVINALSDGKCPGWLDEGLAQLIEGNAHPQLWLALSDYIKKNQEMVPFDRLSRGFTKLPTEMVAPAYGQSLVAASMVESQFGLGAVRTFLEKLRSGIVANDAFRSAFGIPFAAFQTRVRDNLRSGRFRRGEFR